MTKINFKTKLSLCLLIGITSSSYAQTSNAVVSTTPIPVREAEHSQPIRKQKDFFDRYSPLKSLQDNRTPARSTRINSHLDVSMFSEEVIETAGFPTLLTARQYQPKDTKKDFSRLLPSSIGPTGLIDSISANGLSRGEFNAAYTHVVADNKIPRTFRNVNVYEATDVNILFNYGLADNFELMFKFTHLDRSSISSLGSAFDTATSKLPEYGYGFKAHQNWRGKEFAIGFVNANIDSVARNLILDPDFEYFKSIYFTMTNDLTYRTESHITIKRNTSDKKYTANNSWFSMVGGVDTKLTKDTHLLLELKYEDYTTPSKTLTMNGGIRHIMGSTGLEGFVRRINQPGFTEFGVKVSSAF